MKVLLKRQDCPVAVTSSEGGYTALFIAACVGNTEVARLLIQKSVIDRPDHNNVTPLMASIVCRNWAVAHVLLQAGALPSKRDATGATLMDYAQSMRAEGALTRRLAAAGAVISEPPVAGQPTYTAPARITLKWQAVPPPGAEALSPERLQEYLEEHARNSDVEFALLRAELVGTCVHFEASVLNKGQPITLRRWGAALLSGGNEYQLKVQHYREPQASPLVQQPALLEPDQQLEDLTGAAIPTDESIVGWAIGCAPAMSASLFRAADARFLFTCRNDSGALHKFVGAVGES